jgi:glucose dehydrogenase
LASGTIKTAVGVSFIAALVAATALFAADSTGAPSKATPTATTIRPAPSFTPAQLTALPTTAWITDGGNLFNQRYSPLKQLDRTNVKELKAVWRASLNGSGLGRQSSAQPQMLESSTRATAVRCGSGSSMRRSAHR